MESIISPWFIYMLGIVDALRIFFIIISAISAATLLVGVIHLSIAADSINLMKTWRATWSRIYKKAIILLTIAIFISIFTPSKNTLIAMYVADNITWNTMEKAKDITINFKNEIKKDAIDIINAITQQDSLK